MPLGRPIGFGDLEGIDDAQGMALGRTRAFVMRLAARSSRVGCPDYAYWIQQSLAKSPEDRSVTTPSASSTADDVHRPLSTTNAEWKKILTPEQSPVTRQKGTEVPFSGEYWNCHRPGVYRCAVLRRPAALFESDAKFDSGVSAGRAF